MTEELKQAARQALIECPFCGSEPHDAHHIEYGRWAVTCRCGAKGASANTGPNATDAAKIKAYSDARTAWNTRAITQRPAAQEGEVDIKSRVSELIAEHGTLRAAARSLNIDVGYLSRLEHGDKVHPSSETLAKIGLRDAGVKYQRLVFLPTQPAAQATPEPDVAHLVASIKDDAKHAAYMAEIDNTDARDNYLHKLALSLDDLASRVHQQATPERHLTVTTNPQGEAVMVSWQDDEHRILEVVWERKQATPEPVGEVVAWRLRASVESCGLQRFMTQAKYEKQTPAIKKWYEPFKCQSCVTPKPEPMTQAMPQDMGHTTIMGDCIYAGIFEDEISEVNSAVVIKFESDDKLRDFLRWHHGITKEQA